LFQQVQQHTGIEGAAARAHHQAVQGRKSHGGGHALAMVGCTQAGAIAQVGHQQPLVCA